MIVLIFVSIIVTSKYVFDKYGSINIASVGVVEFFIVSVLLGNNILQVCAPIIPIFATLDISGVYDDANDNVFSTKKNVFIRIVLTIIVASAYSGVLEQLYRKHLNSKTHRFEQCAAI